MKDFFKAITNAVTEKANDIGKTIENVSDNVGYGLKNMAENTSRDIKNISEGVSYSVKNSIDDISKTASVVKDNIEYSVSSNIESASRNMKNIGESIDYHINSVSDDISTTNKTVSENFQQFKDEQTVKAAEIVDSIEQIPVVGEPVKVAHKILDTANNIRTQNDPIEVLKRLSETTDEDVFEFGDHLMQLRVGFTHHGIYIGGGDVIHYTIDGVVQTTLDVFKDGSPIRKMSNQESPALVSQPTIVRNARSRIGEKEYDPVTNNCEHFARWCRTNRI